MKRKMKSVIGVWAVIVMLFGLVGCDSKKVAQIELAPLENDIRVAVGETYDFSKLSLNIFYDDGTTDVINVDNKMVSDYDSSTKGLKKCVIKYKRKEVQVTFQVVTLIEKCYYELNLNGPNSYCYKLGDDASYLTVDTDPFDREDYRPSVFEKVKEINKFFGFTSSLYNDMGHTSAMDGKQTRENEKIRVIWKYHPTNGLEITYSEK